MRSKVKVRVVTGGGVGAGKVGRAHALGRETQKVEENKKKKLATTHRSAKEMCPGGRLRIIVWRC